MVLGPKDVELKVLGSVPSCLEPSGGKTEMPRVDCRESIWEGEFLARRSDSASQGHSRMCRQAPRSSFRADT